jgi:hypothetical protein
MSPHIMAPLSRPAKSRGGRPEEDEGTARTPFLLAVSRAFLIAVCAHDRDGSVLFSRAMLNIMNKG